MKNINDSIISVYNQGHLNDNTKQNKGEFANALQKTYKSTYLPSDKLTGERKFISVTSCSAIESFRAATTQNRDSFDIVPLLRESERRTQVLADNSIQRTLKTATLVRYIPDQYQAKVSEDISDCKQKLQDIISKNNEREIKMFEKYLKDSDELLNKYDSEMEKIDKMENVDKLTLMRECMLKYEKIAIVIEEEYLKSLMLGISFFNESKIVLDELLNKLEAVAVPPYIPQSQSEEYLRIKKPETKDVNVHKITFSIDENDFKTDFMQEEFKHLVENVTKNMIKSKFLEWEKKQLYSI